MDTLSVLGKAPAAAAAAESLSASDRQAARLSQRSHWAAPLTIASIDRHRASQ